MSRSRRLLGGEFDTPSIRVPVKLVDGQWEFFYGGPLPLENGAVGELIVDVTAINNDDFLSRLRQRSDHKLLGLGTELLVALTVKPDIQLDSELWDCLLSSYDPYFPIGEDYHYRFCSNHMRLVRVMVGGPTDTQLRKDPQETGGVWLHLEGMRPTGISTSRIRLPEQINDGEADSLNHAFTLLSEVFEPWRKSHTGNIYERVLYQESNDKWYPLDVLRNAAIATDEQEFIKNQWAKISQRLGLQHTGPY